MNALTQSLPALLASFTGGSAGAGAGAGTSTISTSALQGVTSQQSDLQFQLAQLLQQSVEQCGVECQKQKKEEQLKQRWQALQAQEQMLPTEAREAEQKYLQFRLGDVEYRNHKEKELKKEARRLTTDIKAGLEKECGLASTMLAYLETVTRNYTHLVEYARKQRREANTWIDRSEELEETIYTNQRKTYYEQMGISNLNRWYTFIWFLYYIAVVGYISKTVGKVRLGEQTTGGAIMLVLFLIFLPYWLPWVVRIVTTAGQWMYDWTANSAYNHVDANASASAGL